MGWETKNRSVSTPLKHIRKRGRGIILQSGYIELALSNKSSKLLNLKKKDKY